jgi:acyl-CoA hydrolase
MEAQEKKEIREILISRIIKSEDLNHHGTLFAGRMAEWLVEACLISAIDLLRKPEDIVCARIHGMNFLKSSTSGDIIEIRSRIAHLGEKSLTADARIFVTGRDETPSVTGMVTFVTVDKNGVPYAHGMTLSQEYIEANREIHHAALAARTHR